MKNFEEDVVHMIENIKFRNVNDKFLYTLDNDLRKIKSSPNVFCLLINHEIYTNVPRTNTGKY